MELVKQKIRVLIADDHPVIRNGVKSLTEKLPQIEVVGEAEDGRDAHREACRLKPDVVVIDISMPQMDGIAATALIKHDCPNTKIVALSIHEERTFVHQILDAGASGYLLKRSALEELGRAIQAVHAGGTFIDPGIAQELINPALSGKSGVKGVQKLDFSERENDVAHLIVRGFANKEIASQMNLSVKTIETYKTRIFTKLGIHSRADLVRHAMDHGWFEKN